MLDVVDVVLGLLEAEAQAVAGQLDGLDLLVAGKEAGDLIIERGASSERGHRERFPCPESPLLQPHPLDLLRRFLDRKSTRLNSSHVKISYAVFCLKKK